ncbi:MULTISPECIES: MerR family transcriptional regulator [unclassified Enterococcus]|uniref:MerR family transcriptional regulator n=1 Tax=unclassified Enterococcus TaxID=2608891 RepID=UPI001905BA8F|nr:MULTISPECIES: MerR family transcriptional regulator [unclassified Enterococcus]MBK0039232.1 MerR family transcriptional regulator [Enterococcus sp. S52]MBK0071880.1 MerR family transcriptional regulator [Enterococcus sp. S53]MBK0142472.1 MerR family transcriptional regulator [Enterococcus sp. S76]MBK0146167.1 MerR family transcriptional regulator [Enterococcus sp. S77]
METKYVCKLHKISKHGLRYYEHLGLISPKRKANGYREYLVTDIEKLSTIMLFRYFDLPLDVIEILLNQRDVEQTVNYLSEELIMMDEKISNLIDKKNLLQKYIQHTEKSKIIPKNEIKIRKIEKRYAVASQANYFNLDESFCGSKILFQESVNTISVDRFNLYGNIVKREGGLEKYQPVFLLNKGEGLIDKNLLVIPEGTYAEIVVKGRFDRNELLKEIEYYTDQQGYMMSNFILESYLITFYESTNIKEHVTRIEVKLEKVNRQ